MPISGLPFSFHFDLRSNYQTKIKCTVSLKLKEREPFVMIGITGVSIIDIFAAIVLEATMLVKAISLPLCTDW